jgi:hypothetical protein
MARRTRYEQKQHEIFNFFEGLQNRIFTFSDLKRIFEQNRKQWNLPASMGLNKFISELINSLKIQKVKIEFPSLKITRFVWGENYDRFVLCGSLNEKAYFSHLSAMYLNGLTDLVPKDIYVNIEQQQRPQNKQKLTQDGIDRAFQNRSRITNNCAKIDGFTIHLLNGKQTGNLGVIKKEYQKSEAISLTSIERTLIDIVEPIRVGFLRF